MAADIASGMVKKMQGPAETRAWNQVEASFQDMWDLRKFADDTFTHVVTSFALLTLKEQEDMVKTTTKMYRVLKDGVAGVVTSWAGTVEILWSSNLHFCLYA